MNKHLWSTKLTNNDSSKREELGAVRREWNSTDECFKVYKYVQASLITSSGDASNGIPLYWYDTKGTIATDRPANTHPNLPAGICIGTLSDQKYGWIQIGGYHSAVKTNGDDDVADGSSVVGTFANRVTDSIASGTASSVKIFGIAVAADVDASDTVATLLDCTYGDIIQ